MLSKPLDPERPESSSPETMYIERGLLFPETAPRASILPNEMAGLLFWKQFLSVLKKNLLCKQIIGGGGAY